MRPSVGEAGALGQLALALLAEELARASGGIAVSPLVSAYMAAPHVVYGSAEQRAAYLPALARGDSVAAIAVTEPGAGSALDTAYQEAEGSYWEAVLNPC